MNHALQIFKIFEKRGHSHFPHKNGGVGKISLMFILTNPLQCYLSLSVWCVCVCVCVCVFCLFTPFLLVLCFTGRMMMVNCFWGMFDWWKAGITVRDPHCQPSWDHCQRSSPSWISNMPQAGFEPVQNLFSGFDQWSCAVGITTIPPHH